MGFHSMDLIAGQEFEADFYIREDNGIFIKDLSRFSAGASDFDIYEIDTRKHVVGVTPTVNTEEEGKHFVRLNMTGYVTGTLLHQTVEGKDDQYLNRSGYYAVLTVGFSDGEAPVTAFINKLNILG